MGISDPDKLVAYAKARNKDENLVDWKCKNWGKERKWYTAFIFCVCCNLEHTLCLKKNLLRLALSKLKNVTQSIGDFIKFQK